MSTMADFERRASDRQQSVKEVAVALQCPSQILGGRLTIRPLSLELLVLVLKGALLH